MQLELDGLDNSSEEHFNLQGELDELNIAIQNTQHDKEVMEEDYARMNEEDARYEIDTANRELETIDQVIQQKKAEAEW